MAVALLIAARPIAGDEQFPRGLMASAEPKANRSCTIETRPLSFGIYDPLAETDLDAIGQIIYTCENGNLLGRAKPEQKGIRIEMAQGYSNSFAPRRMSGLGRATSSTTSISTRLTARSGALARARTEVYIDEHPPNRTQVIVPVFGRIFGRQDVPAGPYADNVPVRILF